MNKKYIVAVKYSRLEKPKLFGTDIEGLKIGDQVTVNSDRGYEIGVIAGNPINTDTYPSSIDVPDVVSNASPTELKLYQDNLKRAKNAIKIAEEEANSLKLNMHFLFAEYILDASKIIITYTAENRVDFRELLKVLASRLHTRIEFHQIGPRDKAKATGGVGPCGREICCMTFLKNFDGISINRAKNQQLSLNNAKLSGACGKLMCCLLYEDETYTLESKSFPQIGSIIKKNNKSYKVLGFNIVSRTVKCESDNGIELIPLKELRKDRWNAIQILITKNQYYI